MKLRNGKELAEFRTNAKLNFCLPVQKEKKITLKVKTEKIRRCIVGISGTMYPIKLV